MSQAMTLGVDAGSRDVKLAIGRGREIIFSAVVDTVRFYLTCRNGGKELLLNRLPQMESAPEYSRIVATGYGRNNIALTGGEVIPEIMAHATGAVAQTGLGDFTLVDLGGQDTKVIQVVNAEVDDFVMNDKCAAGSGRYLENIAAALGTSLDKLGECWENPVRLSNTCAIFGESEVVGLISDGAPVESILAGANFSVVARLKPLIMRYRPKVIIATGGVAKNQAIRRLLEQETGVEVIQPKEPQLNGAIGCVAS